MNHTDPGIDSMLQRFRPVLAKDFEKYRNHVYRVFSNCLLIDNDASRREKYAIAAVFHDIGIWTDHTFDYLDPSITQAHIYLREVLMEEYRDEISEMIFWHHKLSRYTGVHEKTVETFRKADWIDVSLGLLRFGLDAQKISWTRKQFPNAGFHWFLVKQSAQNLFKHPLNPLPVFKK